MRPRRFILPQAGTGGYGIRPYIFLWRAEPPRRGRCPAWSCLPLVESETRRGAFYMRPRRFALPQAGTGGYGIRPYIFEGAAPRAEGAKGRVFACCACKRIYFVIFYNSQFTKKNDRLSSNKSRRFCRYFSGFVPKKCRGTLSLLFRCPSACVPQQNPAH